MQVSGERPIALYRQRYQLIILSLRDSSLCLCRNASLASMHSVYNKLLLHCGVLILNVPAERFAEVHNTMMDD